MNLKLPIEKFGKENQLRIVQEECAELIQAISKHLRDPKNVVKTMALCEEIVDVEIMLAQLRIMFGSEMIDHYKEIKLDRLKRLCDRS